jgi:hypothetical protein
MSLSVDVGEAHPVWVGVFDAVALAALGAMIGARDDETGR